MFWKNWIAAAVLLVAVPAAAQVSPALLNPNTTTEAQLGSMPHFNALLA